MENTCLIILLFYGQLIQEKCIILNIFTIYSTKTYLLLNVLYPQNTPHQSTTILDHLKEKKHLYFSTTQKAKLFILSSGKKFVLSMKKNYIKIIITTRHPKKVKSLYSTSKYHTTKNNHTTHRTKKILYEKNC